jgi:hypothetical protein
LIIHNAFSCQTNYVGRLSSGGEEYQASVAQQLPARHLRQSSPGRWPMIPWWAVIRWFSFAAVNWRLLSTDRAMAARPPSGPRSTRASACFPGPSTSGQMFERWHGDRNPEHVVASAARVGLAPSADPLMTDCIGSLLVRVNHPVEAAEWIQSLMQQASNFSDPQKHLKCRLEATRRLTSSLSLFARRSLASWILTERTSTQTTSLSVNQDHAISWAGRSISARRGRRTWVLFTQCKDSDRGGLPSQIVRPPTQVIHDRASKIRGRRLLRGTDFPDASPLLVSPNGVVNADQISFAAR